MTICIKICEILTPILNQSVPNPKSQRKRLQEQLFTDLRQPVPCEGSCRMHVDKLAADEFNLLKKHFHGKHIFLLVDQSEG
ncbi:unnamed protein product [Clavelina lepadiformis]|uniref:Uncharacterized protein n=1 Tax=Clavelina lepadiformis TaxID=159417 RepID=A0ABP0G0V1_CLALP